MSPVAAIGLGVPQDLSLPYFAYGLLRPGEFAHKSTVGSDLVRSVPATLLDATLRYRDGLPLLDETTPIGRVQGDLLWVAGDGYQRIGEFEPRQHYRWAIRLVKIDGAGEVRANVLAGKSPRKGSSQETFESWTSAEDPILTFGISAVTELAHEVALESFPVMPGTSPELWSRFFRLSATYLLLWSAVERYTALAFGPGLDPMDRVRRLDESSSFHDAVLQVGVDPGQRVVDSRDPASVRCIREDGSGAAQYWYAVRSNLSHRGKSAFRDGQLLRRSLIDLHDVVKIVLDAQRPEVAAQWDYAPHDGLLRQRAEPDA